MTATFVWWIDKMKRISLFIDITGQIIIIDPFIHTMFA